MTQSKEMQVVYEGLQTVPDLFLEVRSGIAAGRALLSAPRAAMSAGSPFMAAAIVAVGLELGMFIIDAIQAIDEDIDNLRETYKQYKETDEEAQAGSQQVQAQLCSGTLPVGPGGVSVSDYGGYGTGYSGAGSFTGTNPGVGSTAGRYRPDDHGVFLPDESGTRRRVIDVDDTTSRVGGAGSARTGSRTNLRSY